MGLTESDRQGDAVRRARHRAGLSHQQLAHEIGWTAARVRRLESGDEFPTHLVLVSIALATGVTLLELTAAAVPCPGRATASRPHVAPLHRQGVMPAPISWWARNHW